MTRDDPDGSPDRIDHVAQFAAAASWFGERLRGADLRADVPTCPGWTVLDLARHLGNTHAWAATVVETGRAAQVLDDGPAWRRSKAAATWYLAKAEDLYQVLKHSDPASPAWNFAFGEGDAAFWARRQAHETLMHSVDLGLVTGATPALTTRLAVDGIDEALAVFLVRMHARGEPAHLSAPLTLRAPDGPATWTLLPRDGAPAEVLRDGPPQDACLEAPADVLLQVLWKRLPADHPAVSVSGDPAVAAAFLAGPVTA